jgi:hypothetical protein
LYPAIVRHRAGGQIDEQFGTNGLAHGAFEGNQWESQLFLQPDGKIMEAGNSFLGSNVFFLSRYHGDLPIEPTETLKH